MAAESTVGLRILMIGKDGVLAGFKELQAASAKLSESFLASGDASKVAAAGYAEQEAGLVALGAKMDLYDASLAASAAATDALAKVGKAAFFTLAAAGAAWTYESIKWAQSYQTALVQLRTQAGLTTKAMNAIGAAAMKNAATVGMSPTEYLQAAYHPASTGFGTKETIAITNYAGMESVISGANAEDTTNSLTSVMKAYNFGTKQTEGTIAKLNAIVGAGNMHFSDLNSALASGIASTAKTFGVSLTSVGGALAYLTDRGTPAAQAGTRLRMAISLLGAPSKAAATLEQDAGLTDTAAATAANSLSQTLYTAGVQPTQLSAALRNNSGKGGIYNALALLKKHLAGLTPEMQSAMISRSFGGGRMGTTIEAMYNNIPGLGAKSTQIQKGSTDKKYMQDWAKATGTLDYALGKLGHTLETLGTQFGTDLLPYVTDAVKDFTGFFDFLNKNKEVAIILGGAITAVLVPAIGVYLKRALLSTNGSIMTVIKGYGNLLSSQSAQQAALAKTDAALAANDTALVTNDGALTTNAGAQATDDAARAGGGAGLIGGALNFLKGAGGFLVGVGATAYGISKLGAHGTSVLNNQKVPKLDKATKDAYKTVSDLQVKISKLQQQMTYDSGRGLERAEVAVQSWGVFGDASRWLTAERIPILGNNSAGDIAKDKVLLGQYQKQLKTIEKLHPDYAAVGLEDAKKSVTSATTKPIQINVTVHTTLDGKELTKSVTKHTKATAALTG